MFRDCLSGTYNNNNEIPLDVMLSFMPFWLKEGRIPSPFFFLILCNWPERSVVITNVISSFRFSLTENKCLLSTCYVLGSMLYTLLTLLSFVVTWWAGGIIQDSQRLTKFHKSHAAHKKWHNWNRTQVCLLLNPLSFLLHHNAFPNNAHYLSN